MVRFETKIYNYSADEKIIGAEVIVYNESGDKVKSIIVTDETKLQELEEKLDTLDDTYVDEDELTTILTNSNEDTVINATLLNGYQGDQFVLNSQLEGKSFKPKAHASSSNEYGVGNASNYGHVKIRDNLNSTSYVAGEALSPYQGKVLDDKITAANQSNIVNSLHILIGRYEDKAGEYGTRIVAQRGVNGLYARILCEDPDFDASKLTLYMDINGTSYEFKSTNTDANRKLVDATDIPGTVISGRLGIGSALPLGEHILLAFCKYNNNTVYPANTMKRIVVQ